MERYRAMHKSSSRMSPLSKLKEKSKIARTNSRNDRFLNSRVVASNFDNLQPDNKDEIKETRSRQQLYLERYIAWKQEKAKRLEAQKSECQIKPFVSVVKSSNIKNTIAPQNHVFKAPQNLKDPSKQMKSKPILRSQQNKLLAENFIFAEPKPRNKQYAYSAKPLIKNNNTNVNTNRLVNKQKIALAKPITTENTTKPSIKITKPQVSKISQRYLKPNILNGTKIISASKSKKVSKLKIDCNPVNGSFTAPSTKTPIDFDTNFAPFSKFITSTKRKTAINNDLNTFTQIISPIDFENDQNENCFSAVKKNKCGSNSAIQDTFELGKTNGNVCAGSPMNHVYNPERFKFVRYSNVKTPKACRKSFNKLAMDTVGDSKNIAATTSISNENQPVADLNTTPVSSFVVRQLNCVSPFPRNCSVKTNNKEISNNVLKDSQPNASLEYKDTMEIVKYYRKQLKAETSRLLDLCDEWHKYKEINFLTLDENSIDMIDVVIGQTKLLTSKKFEQFRGLIDKCERGAIERNNGEAPKQVQEMAILSGDLEGFWSMVYIQVENLEKRFENLCQWRDNNWSDPEEIKIKNKKNLTKVKKIKKNVGQKQIKVNSPLKAIMRKIHANFRKNMENDKEKLVQIVTPESRRSPGQIMLPKLDSPKQNPFFSFEQKNTNLLKSVLMTEQEKTLTPNKIKTPKNGRKSRNSFLMSFSPVGKTEKVFFNEYKDSKSDEEEWQFYKLRGRRVKLRDISASEIPKP